MTDYYCYILECADGTFYTGWTMDPARRLREHNGGYGARYTRSRRPVRLVYLEEKPDQRSAMRRERKIKSMGRKGKKSLIGSETDLSDEII
jgi:putative endonuclease